MRLIISKTPALQVHDGKGIVWYDQNARMNDEQRNGKAFPEDDGFLSITMNRLDVDRISDGIAILWEIQFRRGTVWYWHATRKPLAEGGSGYISPIGIGYIRASLPLLGVLGVMPLFSTEQNLHRYAPPMTMGYCVALYIDGMFNYHTTQIGVTQPIRDVGYTELSYGEWLKKRLDPSDFCPLWTSATMPILRLSSTEDWLAEYHND